MIYLDNSATTRPRQEVIDSYVKVAKDFFGNPSSIHHIGTQAEKLLREARRQFSSLLGVQETEIIFTSGGTESNNMAIKGVAHQFHTRGKHIITSSIEHPSVTEVCEQLKQEGFEITYLPVDRDGRVSVEDVKNALREDTILVSIMHVNNEVGTIQPIKEIGKLLTDYPKVVFHVDYVQGVGKVPLNFQECHIDLASFSGHKFHGLKGTGALYLRSGLRIHTLLNGGGQESNRRSGTENVAGIVAMAKALRLATENMEEKVKQMNTIKAYFFSELKNIPEVIINTPKNLSAPHIINFSVPGFKTEVLVHAISEKGVMVSTNSACHSKLNEPSHTLLAMGCEHEIADSSLRISLSYETTMDEAKTAMKAIEASINELKKVMRR